MPPISSYATLLSLLLASCATVANAHGYVGRLTANGKDYTGPGPVDQAGTLAIDSPIRQIASEQPVTDVTTPLIACGLSTSAPAKSVAAVTAGSVVSVTWFDGGGQPAWPHNSGPILTYMAPCATTACDDDPTTLNFFKIAEDGQVPGDPTKWVQADLMTGAPYNITIPSGVPNGAYILRNEIISLQNAASGNAESYPSCSQVLVSGGSSTSQSAFMASLGSNATIHLPGGYNKKDPGWNVDVYTNPSKLDYSTMFPGPSIPAALSKAGGGGTSATGTTSSAVAPTTTSSIASTMTSALSNENSTKTITTSAIFSTSTSPSITTTAATTTSPAASNGPMVYTTTLTQILVLTITLPDTNNNNTDHGLLIGTTTTTNTAVPSTTITSSSTRTTLTMTEDPDCDDETVTSITRTTSSMISTKTVPSNRRRSRRYNHWRR